MRGSLDHGQATGRDRVEQFRADEEHHSGAGQRQQPPAVTRIRFEIRRAALDRAERDRIGHQPRIGARLDGEQPGEALAHTDG
jgi:hypothetical protein